MPSELPRMPGETHQTLIRFGETPGLGLRAGEVAWYPNKNDLDARLKRYGTRLGIVALVGMVALSVLGIVNGST